MTTSITARLRDAVCLVLATLAILATQESRARVDGVVLRPADERGNRLTYDRARGEVHAEGERPALLIDLGDRRLSSLQLDIMGVDESVTPNYDMMDLRLGPSRALPAVPGESATLRPISSGRPDIRDREILWQVREPISGEVLVYPPPGSRFVINGVYTVEPSGRVPLFVLLTAILGVYMLAGRWSGLPRIPAAFAVLSQALWSIALVFWAALLVSYWFVGDYVPQSQGSLQPYMIQDWPEFFVDETPEKLLVAIFYVGGAFAALLGPGVLSRVRHAPALLWPGLVLFAPAAALAAASIMEPYRSRVESVAGRDVPLGPWFWLAASLLVLIGSMAASVWRQRHAADADAITAWRGVASEKSRDAADAGGMPHDWRDWLVYLALAMAAFPSNVTAAAVRIGFETHVLSYIIGPAMYAAYGDGLVPGRDFFPQYGVGAGPLFAPFLGSSAQDAITNYVVLSAITLGLFFAGAYLIARRMLRSRLWAFVVVTIGFVQHFHLSVSGSGNMFDPTGWPVRFPLLPLFLWALVRGLVNHGRTIRADLPSHALIGAIVALSFFWNTETGLYMAVTAFAANLLLFGLSLRTVQTFGVLAGVIASTFMLLSAAAFGWGAMSADYFWVLYMPLVVYGGGWSARMMDWGGHWTVVYGLVLPAIGIATVGWGARLMNTRWLELDAEERERVAWRLTLSIVGLLLVAKFYNRSLNTLFWFNSLPLLLVGASWLKEYCRSVANGTQSTSLTAVLRTAAALVLISAYLYTLADPRPDNQGHAFGVRAWLKHPSMLSEAFGRRHFGDWSELGNPLSPRVVQAIQERVPEGRQAAFISPVDWRYLILARRAPKAHFLPSTDLQLRYQLDASVEGANVLFMHLQPSGLPYASIHRTLWRHLEPLLASRYQLETTVDDVAIYVRRDRTARR